MSTTVTGAPRTSAPRRDACAREPALVLASHGTSDDVGRRTVAALVAAVTAAEGSRRPGTAVRGCFVDVQHPDVPETLDALDPSTPAVVVPLLVSAGYHVHVDLAEAARDAADRVVTVTGALGPDVRLADLLARRLDEAGLRDDDVVVLAAAGSSNASAVADCLVAGDLLAARLGRPVTVGYLSAAHPRLKRAVTDARSAHPGRRIVVATYLLAPGYFADLAARCGADLVSAPLLVDHQPPPAELVEIVADLFEGVLDDPDRDRDRDRDREELTGGAPDHHLDSRLLAGIPR